MKQNENLIKIAYACIGFAVGFAFVALFLPALSVIYSGEESGVSVWLTTCSISASGGYTAGLTSIGLNAIIPVALIVSLILAAYKKGILSSAFAFGGVFLPFLSAVTYLSQVDESLGGNDIKVKMGVGTVFLIISLVATIAAILLFALVKESEQGKGAKKESALEELVKWNDLYKQEIITKDEFDAKKAEILNKQNQ